MIDDLNFYKTQRDFELLYRNSLSKRYHKEPYLTQDLQQHTFGMLLIATHFFKNLSMNLVRAIMAHDLAEGTYGDIPYETKREFLMAKELDEEANHAFWQKKDSYLKPDYNKLSSAEVFMLNFIDRLECLFFLKNHPNLHYYADMYNRIHKRVTEEINQLSEKHTRFSEIISPFEITCLGALIENSKLEEN